MSGAPSSKALARQLGIADATRFLGWRDDMREVYADLDVVTLCSNNEGSPVALIEALAAARPVVATRVGGVPNVVQDGESGLLVPPRDPAALAEGVLTLLRDPGPRRAARSGRTASRLPAARLEPAGSGRRAAVPGACAARRAWPRDRPAVRADPPAGRAAGAGPGDGHDAGRGPDRRPGRAGRLPEARPLAPLPDAAPGRHRHLHGQRPAGRADRRGGLGAHAGPVRGAACSGPC